MRANAGLAVAFFVLGVVATAQDRPPATLAAKAERARKAWAEVEDKATAERDARFKKEAGRALELATAEHGRLIAAKAPAARIKAAADNVAAREKAIANPPTGIVSPRVAPAMIGVGSVGKLFPNTALKVTRVVGPAEGYVASLDDVYLVHAAFDGVKAGDFLKVRGIVECTGKHEVTDVAGGKKRIVYEWWVYDN